MGIVIVSGIASRTREVLGKLLVTLALTTTNNQFEVLTEIKPSPIDVMDCKVEEADYDLDRSWLADDCFFIVLGILVLFTCDRIEDWLCARKVRKRQRLTHECWWYT